MTTLLAPIPLTGHAPGLLADTVAAHSRFLHEAIQRHPDWLTDLSTPGALDQPRSTTHFEAELVGLTLTPELLAAFRRKQLLRILLRDVLQLTDLTGIVTEISALADAILRAAWQQVRRDLGPGGECSILALGKLGGSELNYSSDIDLLFLCRGRQDVFRHATHRLTDLISSYTPEGICYRVDLRLRPDGRTGEICPSLDSARTYYSTRARDWELQMLLKARCCAGDEAPARELLDFVQPLIYQHSPGKLDAIWSAREAMEEKLRRRREGAGLDIKLTRGGIRDIEFLTQCLQRLHGTREPWLRHGSTLNALARLRDQALLTPAEHTALARAYEFFRHLEHRLQVLEDRQTHTLPPDTPADLMAEVQFRLSEVRALHDRLLGSGAEPATQATPPTQPPAENFLTNLPAELNSLLETQPKLAACTRDLFAHSQYFADQLTRHPALLHQVAAACGERQGRTGFDPPLDPAQLRRFFREQMVRIQADSIHHGVPIFKTLKRTSNLADAILRAALQIAAGDTPPGVMVIALGRLGMREFDLDSDADLIFVIPDSEAPRLEHWTRIAERLIHIVTDYTADGTIFAIDTRLRPNGHAGALVQTESACKDYFQKSAQAWEGISYMKARAIAGDLDAANTFLNTLQEVDWRHYGQSFRSRSELAKMRARLENELGHVNPLKAAPGGYYDIDFALMYLRLKSAGIFFKVLNTPERIDIIEKMGHLEREDASFLQQSAAFFRAVDHGLRVATGQASGRLPNHPAELAALTGLVRRWVPETLQNDPLPDVLHRIQQQTRALYVRLFGEAAMER